LETAPGKEKKLPRGFMGEPNDKGIDAVVFFLAQKQTADQKEHDVKNEGEEIKEREHCHRAPAKGPVLGDRGTEIGEERGEDGLG